MGIVSEKISSSFSDTIKPSLRWIKDGIKSRGNDPKKWQLFRSFSFTKDCNASNLLPDPINMKAIFLSGWTSAAEDHLGLAKNILLLMELSEKDRRKLGKNGKKYFKENFSDEIFISNLKNYIEKISNQGRELWR